MPSLLQQWVRRLRRAHPDHHAIARAMVRVVIFVLLGSVARVAKEMAIAYRYGVGAEVDAYLFVFNLVTWPVGVWFGVLTVVLVPLAARLRHGDSADLPAFRSELLGVTLLAGLALAMLGYIGLPWLLRSASIGLPVQTIALAVEMGPAMAVLAMLGVVISLLSAWMMSSGRHASTLFEAIPSLTLFLLLVSVAPDGVDTLVWGSLAGFAFHLAALAAPMAARGEIGVPHFSRRSSHWPAFWQGFGIMLVGQALLSFSALVDQFFAGHLPTGSIATLGYANRVLALILGVGALAVSRATLPVFAAAKAEGAAQLASLAWHWSRIMLLMGVAALVVGWWLTPLVVRLMFERGAFGPQDSVAVVQILQYLLLQLPFYFSGLVFASYLSSLGAYRVLLWSGVIGLAVKLIANAALAPSFGLAGIAFATVMMYGANFVFFLGIFRMNTRPA